MKHVIVHSNFISAKGASSWSGMIWWVLRNLRFSRRLTYLQCFFSCWMCGQHNHCRKESWFCIRCLSAKTFPLLRCYSFYCFLSNQACYLHLRCTSWQSMYQNCSRCMAAFSLQAKQLWPCSWQSQHVADLGAWWNPCVQSCSSPSATLGHTGFCGCDLYFLQNQWLFGHSASPHQVPQAWEKYDFRMQFSIPK